jgi:hypothetical protein
MKLYTRSDLIGLGILAIIGVTTLVANAVERNRLTPQATATSLSAFAASLPAPQQLAVVNDSGETKVVWVGDNANWTFFPTSGPACYVFDSSGTLIQWELETGHGRVTDRLVRLAWHADSLTVQDAIDFTGG